MSAGELPPRRLGFVDRSRASQPAAGTPELAPTGGAPPGEGAAAFGSRSAAPVPVDALQGLPDLSRQAAQEFRRLFGTQPDGELARRFDLSVPQILALARRYALGKDKAFQRRQQGLGSTRMPRWTDPELALLTELYATTANLEIAQRLGRTVKSVVSKAHHLGLRKSALRLAEMGRQNVAARYSGPSPVAELAPARSQRGRTSTHRGASTEQTQPPAPNTASEPASLQSPGASQPAPTRRRDP